MTRFDYGNPYYGNPKNKIVAAAGNGDTETVEAILQGGLHPDADFVQEPCAPLFYACSGGHLETARALCRAGADVNRYDPKKYPMTYLAVAAQGGHSKVVDWLLQQGANPSIVDPAGYTAADSAAALGHGEIALRLYSAMGVKLTSEQELIFAAQRGELQLVERLLDAGVDYSRPTVGGFNAFMWACMCGHEPTVRLMLTRGASPYTTGEVDGISAMAWASLKGHKRVMETLFEFDQLQQKIFPPPSDLPDLSTMLRNAARDAGRKAKHVRGKRKRDA